MAAFVSQHDWQMTLALPWHELPGKPAALLAAASEIPGQILLVNSKAEK